jgi:hypothetical protein
VYPLESTVGPLRWNGPETAVISLM